MNEYILLQLAVVLTAIGVALIIVANIVLGSVVTLVWKANRRIVEAEAVNRSAIETYWSAHHTLAEVISRG